MKAQRGTMPDAATFSKETRRVVVLAHFSVSAVYLRTLSGLIVRACSAPAKRLCQHELTLSVDPQLFCVCVSNHIPREQNLSMSEQQRSMIVSEISKNETREKAVR